MAKKSKPKFQDLKIPEEVYTGEDQDYKSEEYLDKERLDKMAVDDAVEDPEEMNPKLRDHLWMLRRRRSKISDALE